MIPSQTGPVRGRRAPLLAVLLFAALSLFSVHSLPVPGPHDEWQHLSYAAAVQEAGSLRPRFEAQSVLDPADLRRWTAEPNYIGHPAAYYGLIALVLDRDAPAEAALLEARLASWAFYLLATALALSAGWRWFGGQPGGFLVFAAMVVLCPKQLYLAGHVNNDALAALAGALAYWGASRPGGRPAMAAALMLALWAKPSAGLLLGAWAGLLMLWRRDARLLAWLVAGGLLGLLPYLDFLARYGRIVPVTWEWVSGFAGQPLPLAEGLAAFAWRYSLSWSLREVGGWPMQLAMLGILAAILAGAAEGWRRRDGELGAQAAAFGLAFLIVFALKLGYGLFALGGSEGAATIRYALPLLPVLAHAVALLAVARGGRWPAGMTALLALACLGGVLT